MSYLKSLVTNTTCLHVSNLSKSIKFYSDAFGVSVIKSVDNDKFKSCYIALDSEGHPNKDVAAGARDGVVELRELKNSTAKVHNGNSDPYKGFGHLCYSVSNIQEVQKHLLDQGVEFKKKIEDGRMRNIAFILDPDQYWIELIQNPLNSKEAVYDTSFNRFNHTMIRVKDPVKSLKFYKDVLGMKIFSKKDFPDAKFTLYFLGYEHSDGYAEEQESSDEKSCRQSIIELTHNYGTENDDSFEGYYVFGKDDSVVGFDHFTITCDNSAEFIKQLEAKNTKFVSNSGKSATITDPDGWRIEIHNSDYLNQ